MDHAVRLELRVPDSALRAAHQSRPLPNHVRLAASCGLRRLGSRLLRQRSSPSRPRLRQLSRRSPHLPPPRLSRRHRPRSDCPGVPFLARTIVPDLTAATVEWNCRVGLNAAPFVAPRTQGRSSVRECWGEFPFLPAADQPAFSHMRWVAQCSRPRPTAASPVLPRSSSCPP